MNNFETIFLIKDDISQEQRCSVIEEIKHFLLENGEISEENDIGKRKLAYEIKRHQYAYYVMICFSCRPDILPELEKKYRTNENILKFIIVKQES